MFNKTLYKKEIKGSWKLLLVFLAVITMYFIIIVMMFDPTLGSALNEFAKAFPEMMKIVGMDPSDTTMISFMASYLYGFIMLVFPMVYSIITANRLIARHVDKGSMAYLLAAPVKRLSVVFTQLMVLLTGTVLLIGYATVLGIITAEMQFPNELDINGFLMINLGTLALHLFIAGICFLSSCIFNDTSLSIGFGAGIPAISYVIQMIANLEGKLDPAKYFTFFTFFDTKAIIAKESFGTIGIVVLLIGALILYFISIKVFTKKDLHI